MSSRMVRGFATTAVALAALAAGAGLGAAQADAAPSVSPFAGEYVGQYYSLSGPIKVAHDGKVSGSYRYESGSRQDRQGGLDVWSGRIVGRVSDDGTMSVSGSETYKSNNDVVYDVEFAYGGTAQLNSSGDLVVTSDAGFAFVWVRQ